MAVSRFIQTDLVFYALEHILHVLQVGKGLIHHSDSGVQFLSIPYSGRLKDTGAEALRVPREISATTPRLNPASVCSRPS
jgi:transposase InsO family protein